MAIEKVNYKDTIRKFADKFNVSMEEVLSLGESFIGLDARMGDLTVNVRMFGVVGDGITDDTENLIKARDFVIANGGVFYIPPSMTCYIPNGLDLFGIRNLRIDGILNGKDATTTITIGIRSAVTLPFVANINRVTNALLKVQGIKNGDVTVNSTPHLLLWADGRDVNIASLAYTNFYLGKVDHLEFNSIDTNSWINENKFFGGRITKLTIDGAYAHNHNIFYSPTLENSTVNIIKGASNRIIGCRFEGTNNVTFGVDAWDNEIIRSWHNSPGGFLRGEARTPYTDNGRGNYVTNASDGYYDYYKLFEINTRTTNFNFNNIIKNNGSLEVISKGAYKNVFETDLFPITSDLGIDVSSDGTLWRLYVELYDENKTKISTQPVSSFSSGMMVWNNTNYKYDTTINRNYINLAIFKGTVAKYAKLYLQPHALGAFSYLSVNIRHLRGTKFYIPVLAPHRRATVDSIPIIGTWELGDYAEYNVPTAGGYRGVICTQAGTPGTWKGVGSIQA